MLKIKSWRRKCWFVTELSRSRERRSESHSFIDKHLIWIDFVKQIHSAWSDRLVLCLWLGPQEMPVPADEVRVKEEPPEVGLLHDVSSHDTIRADILPRVSDIPTGRTLLGINLLSLSFYILDQWSTWFVFFHFIFWNIFSTIPKAIANSSPWDLKSLSPGLELEIFPWCPNNPWKIAFVRNENSQSKQIFQNYSKWMALCSTGNTCAI